MVCIWNYQLDVEYSALGSEYLDSDIAFNVENDVFEIDTIEVANDTSDVETKVFCVRYNAGIEYAFVYLETVQYWFMIVVFVVEAEQFIQVCRTLQLQMKI